MKKKNNFVYGPNVRGFMESDDSTKIKSYSKNGNSSVELPNNVEDPIITNNISWSEFDYTYDNGSDITDPDYLDK